MTRTYWLSFCNSAKPEGSQFLGGCVVEVNENDAASALAWIDRMFPHHRDEGGWIAAAARKARTLGCNPGGEMVSIDITDADVPEHFPRGRLLSQAELEAFGPLERLV